MSERTSNKNKWIKRTAGVLVAPIAAVALSSCSSEAKCEPRATVTVTAEAKPTASAPSVKAPEVKPATMNNQQVDAAFAQGVSALKSGDIKGAEKIYSEELLGSGSALGTEKDYDGDGDKEYPWESMKEQLEKAKQYLVSKE